MINTIDVSAAVEIVMGRPKQKLLIDILKDADLILTPSLYIFEASNVMWKYHSILNYPIDGLLSKTRHMIDIVDQFLKSEDIYEESIPLSCKINHPAYDAMYLVTCRRKNSTQVTLDKLLVRAANKLELPVASIS